MKTFSILGVAATLCEVRSTGFRRDLSDRQRDTAVRVRAALGAAGVVSASHLAFEVSGADLAPHMDLAAAVDVVDIAHGVESPRAAFVGEIDLAGRLRPVRGVSAMVAAAREMGVPIVIPAANAVEASYVPGGVVRSADSLKQVISYVRGGIDLPLVDARTLEPTDPAQLCADLRGVPDTVWVALRDVLGEGGRPLLIGHPGVGKIAIARRIPSLLGPMSPKQMVETSAIHSVAGLLSDRCPAITSRPLRAPHHTVSKAGLVGGGTPPRPGEVSLAHHGVLLLDEINEFRLDALSALQFALKNRRARFGRLGDVTIPARPAAVVGTANPCGCGWPGGQCRCTPDQVRAYRDRLDRRAENFGMSKIFLPELEVGIG